MTNCTFSLNTAPYGGGMANYWHSSPTVTNSILWDNGPEIYNENESNPTISFSDIQGCGGSGAGWDTSLGTDGGGNIDAAPLFVNASDPAGPDGIFGTADDGLYLPLGSPCVNSATSVGAPSTDIVGASRPQGAGYDMGAYETLILYQQDFSSGKPSDNWTYYSSTGGGQIKVVNGALRMVSDGTYNLNEAILRLNLTGNTNVQLQFDHRDSLDEPNAMPTGAWAGHQNGDGIAVSSDNGETWYSIWSLGRNKTWTTYTIDLDQAIAIAGISYTSNFPIKFEQYDNSPWGADGREFDNISVYAIAAPINYTQDFSAGKPGASDGWQYYMSASEGRIEVVSGALRMDSSSGEVYSLNEAMLSLNLTGSTAGSGVKLQFDHRDSTDEYHAMPTGTWTGHANGDGRLQTDCHQNHG